MKIIGLVYASIFISYCSFSQNIPSFQSFERITVGKSPTYNPSKTATNSERNINPYKAALQPKPPNTYTNPNTIFNTLNQNNFLLTSSAPIPGKSSNSIQIVKDVLNEVRRQEDLSSYQLPSLSYKPGTENFHTAYQEISEMLDDKRPLDLKRAVFLTENAFLDGGMPYAKFEGAIQEMVQFLRLKMQQEGLDSKDGQTINYLVHRFMSDTLSIDMPGRESKMLTYPKRYDFEDPFGYENPTKMFVSKLLLENTGQCKTLPLLYLILVYELEGNAYLSFSPSHSFVKCKGPHNEMYNVELTNGMLTSDSWVVASGYVKAEAVKSGIYLDTLNQRQVIANTLVDLAKYYGWRYSYDEFVLQCVDKALEYHENNIWAIQVKSDYYTLLMQYVTQELKLNDIQEVKNHPEANRVFLQMNRLYALADGLGYEHMPEEAYMDWLKTLEQKQQQQEHSRQYLKFSALPH